MIDLTQDETAELVARTQRYFEDELDSEIGQFDAEFLLGFFLREIGPVIYNRGLFDARAVLQGKLEEVDLAIDEIAKPTGS